MSETQTVWYTYIVRCSDASLYTGITVDLDRRLAEHNCGPAGAAYTRARRPVTLVYHERFASRSEAAAREYRIKQMDRKEKMELIVCKKTGDGSRKTK